MMRAPDHKNFRECGDQFLRYFLRGLAARQHVKKAKTGMAAMRNMAADRLFHFFKTSGFHHQFHLRHSDTFFGIFSRNVDS